MAPAVGPGAGLIGVGVLLAGAGIALMTGGDQVGLALIGVGLVLVIVGVVLLAQAMKRRGQLPGEFADLGARFRERLYLVLCLRGLYQLASRLTRATDAFDQASKTTAA